MTQKWAAQNCLTPKEAETTIGRDDIFGIDVWRDWGTAEERASHAASVSTPMGQISVAPWTWQTREIDRCSLGDKDAVFFDGDSARLQKNHLQSRFTDGSFVFCVPLNRIAVASIDRIEIRTCFTSEYYYIVTVFQVITTLYREIILPTILTELFQYFHHFVSVCVGIPNIYSLLYFLKISNFVYFSISSSAFIYCDCFKIVSVLFYWTFPFSRFLFNKMRYCEKYTFWNFPRLEETHLNLCQLLSRAHTSWHFSYKKGNSSFLYRNVFCIRQASCLEFSNSRRCNFCFIYM